MLATVPPNELDSRNSVTMDYCKTRSKMPAKLKKMTLLKKPHSRAADSWSNFRSKFSNMIAEHSSKQRVGAYSGQEKVINLEDVYKTSKVRT